MVFHIRIFIWILIYLNKFKLYFEAIIFWVFNFLCINFNLHSIIALVKGHRILFFLDRMMRKVVELKVIKSKACNLSNWTQNKPNKHGYWCFWIKDWNHEKQRHVPSPSINNLYKCWMNKNILPLLILMNISKYQLTVKHIYATQYLHKKRMSAKIRGRFTGGNFC